MDPLMWLTMTVYIGIRIAAHTSESPIDIEVLNNSDIGVLGAFLSFFLIFFVNQTNGRFLEMYGFSRVRDFLYPYFDILVFFYSRVFNMVIGLCR